MAYVIAKYLRISAEDIDLDGVDKYESNSIAHQRALLDDYITQTPEFQGCEVIEEFDDGQSGTNFSRPGIQRLLKMAEAGEVQCIICKDLSRFGRSYIEVGDYLEQKFPAWGLRFISLNDGYDSHKLGGGIAGIDIAFRNLIHELYAHDISKKTRQGKITATQNGKCTNSMPAYGYVKNPLDKRSLLIDEPAAEVVRRIFSFAKEGLQPIQIAKILNDEGIPSPNEHKRQQGLIKKKPLRSKPTFWSGTMVSNLIRGEQYTGTLLFGKKRVAGLGARNCVPSPKSDWIVVPNAIPVIITTEMFNAVNALMPVKLVPKKKKPVTRLFDGKLKCAYCGMALRTYPTKKGLKYYCATPKLTDEYGCSIERIFEADAVLATLTALQLHINIACDIAKIIKAKATQSPSMPNKNRLEREIAELMKIIDKSKTAKISLWEKYHTKAISAEAFKCEHEKIDAQVQKYNGDLLRLHETLADLTASKQVDNAYVERFSNYAGLSELTRDAIINLIEEVRFYSAENIEIHFNFADEYDKVSKMISNL